MSESGGEGGEKSHDVRIVEMPDAGGARGPNIKLYKDGEPERTMLIWCKEEDVVVANDNEPRWAIKAAQEDGWTVAFHQEDWEVPDRIADLLDAESPPHRRLHHAE